ncbi:diguanylate cyclase [Celerinatantimonas sp. YJH-8]|uniref:GGDEF domain-containing protein n=1 Tax=Celerinatantimonas sp. YJH-8 TaxID=3228714 RepID=UPI0038C500EE
MMLICTASAFIAAICLSLLTHNRYLCPGCPYWLTAQWMIALGFLALIGRIWIPVSISVILGNTLVSVSLSFMLLGLLSYHPLLIKRYKLLGLIAPTLMLLSMTVAVATNQSIIIRCHIFDIIADIQLLGCIVACLYQRHPRETGRKLLAGLFLILIICGSLRSLLAHFQHTPYVYFSFSNATLLVMASELLYLIGVSICMPLLTAQWLQLQLAKTACIDQVTGLQNRHGLIEYIDQFTNTQKATATHALAIIDIDHFKQINDQYGHLTGDKILSSVAELIRKHTREKDLAMRYGGEEFVVIFPEQDHNHAISWAERIRKIIENTLHSFENQSLQVTVSIGIAQFCNPSHQAVRQALAAADSALYQAKKNGRNQVQLNQTTVATDSFKSITLW